MSYREPDYNQSPTQNLSLASVAGPRLYPLVWVKAEPPGTVAWGRAVVAGAGDGDRALFLETREWVSDDQVLVENLLLVERDGVQEWFAPAYDYERSPYERMYSICTDWAQYARPFSEEEIQMGKEAVYDVFRTFIGVNQMESLEYDPVRADRELLWYMDGGGGSVNGVTVDNVLILFSRFTTGGEETVRGTNFEPDVTETWMFVLIREDGNSPWVVDTMGHYEP